MILLTLALATVILILFYVYFRDRYEKEPVDILFSKLKLLLLLFVPYLLVLFRRCEVFMKAHTEHSEFALGAGSPEWAPSSGEEHL